MSTLVKFPHVQPAAPTLHVKDAKRGLIKIAPVGIEPNDPNLTVIFAADYANGKTKQGSILWSVLSDPTQFVFRIDHQFGTYLTEMSPSFAARCAIWLADQHAVEVLPEERAQFQTEAYHNVVSRRSPCSAWRGHFTDDGDFVEAYRRCRNGQVKVRSRDSYLRRGVSTPQQVIET